MKNVLPMLIGTVMVLICVTGCERSITKPMMHSATPPETPTKTDSEALAVARVQAAINLYKTEGGEAVIAHYNDPKSIDGQFYVFISDENDIVVAHATHPPLLGTDIKEVKDLKGFPSGAGVAKATGTGRWTEYVSTNPESGQAETKRAWSIRHDGYLFGSGYHQALPAENK